MKKAQIRAKSRSPVPPPKLIKPKKVHWKPPKMAEKKAEKINSTNNEPKPEERLHAAAPETVDTQKEHDKADKLRRDQEALIRKQDEERLAEQKKQDKKA